MAVPSFIRAYLDEHTIPYEVIQHRRDYTAQETAAHTHTPGKSFAKTVILRTNGHYVMAVVPAHRHIDFDKVRAVLHCPHVRLATEEEIKTICPDCEVGAMPPIGTIYDLRVFASNELAHEPEITFNAGTHVDAIRLRYRDFQKLVHAATADLTLPEHEAPAMH